MCTQRIGHYLAWLYSQTVGSVTCQVKEDLSYPLVIMAASMTSQKDSYQLFLNMVLPSLEGN